MDPRGVEPRNTRCKRVSLPLAYGSLQTNSNSKVLKDFVFVYIYGYFNIRRHKRGGKKVL